MPQIKHVFDINKTVEEHGNKILLLGGVGSGKSKWVTDVLKNLGSVLFVTSRKAKALEDINCSDFEEIFKWYTNDNQTLITNAKLSKIIERIADDYMKDLDEFINHFDYIVIDEVHSIVTDSAYASSCPSVLSFIEYVAEKGKVIVCMTGTVEPVKQYFDDNGWYTADYMKICDYVHPKEIALIKERNVFSYIKQYKDTHKIIYFSNHTDTMAKYCKELIEKKILLSTEIATAVAKSKENEFYSILQNVLNDEYNYGNIKTSSETTYKDIITKKLIPSECKILFSTSVLKEGVNIKNRKVIVFCENHVLSNLIQFVGRVRAGAERVFVIEDSNDHPVKHNELLYNYAVTSEAEASNIFYKTCIDDEYNPFTIIEREKLTKHVTNNPYIYFDYIRNEYRVFHLKYNEEVRLLNNYDWETKITEHCKEYSIKKLWFDGGVEQRQALKVMMEKRVKFWVDDELNPNIKHLKNLLNSAYKVTYAQPKKINIQLEEKDAPIRIYNTKETEKVNRNKQYWQVVSTETYNKKNNI